MSETYIQSQFMINKITDDFFDTSSSQKPSIRVKKQTRNNDLDYSVIEEDTIVEPSDTETFDENYTTMDSNDTELDQTFDTCDNDLDVLRSYTIHLCGYKMNREGYLPFLQYMVKNEGDKMVYPSFSFKCASNVQLADENESSHHLYFQNECIKELLHYVSFEHIDDEDTENPFDTMYKGYYKSERLDNTLYVVFNVDKCEVKKDLIPATIDELMNKHEVLGLMVDPSVYNPFYEKRGLTQIKRDDGGIIEIPLTVYKCETDGKELTNEIDDGDDETFSIIDDRIRHPLFGNSYLFSTQPFNAGGDKSKVNRYALFIVKPAYIMDDLSNTQKDDVGFELGTVVPTIASYVSDKINKTPIEEPEENQNQTNDNQEEDEEDEEDEDTVDDIVENDDDEEEDEVIEMLQNITNPVIYYHETRDNIVNNFWCVKSSSFFTQL